MRYTILMAFISGLSLHAQDGTLDLSFIPGDGFDGFPMAGVSSMSIGPDGNAFMIGSFLRFQGRDSSQVARLDLNGDHVPTLTTFLGFRNGTSNVVLRGHVFTPDGKIVVFGQFNEVQGNTRHRIARLNSDGTLDPTFDAGTLYQNNTIWDAGVQSDGKIVVLPATTARIARLNNDGTPDAGFSGGVHALLSGEVGLHVLPDDRLLIFGGFASWLTSPTRGLVKLMPNGALDATFSAGSGVNSNAWIRDLAIDGSNRILIVGTFSSFSGTSTNCKARLSANGVLDPAFDATGTAHGSLESVAISGQSIWVGGAITKGSPYTLVPGIFRLTDAGQLDSGFQPGAGFIGGGVAKVLPQSDGSCLVSGSFRAYNDHSCTGLVRIGADGSVSDHIDRAYGSGFDGNIEDLVIQPDGRIIVVGNFYRFNGQWTPGICRLTPNGGLDETFSTDFQGGHPITEVELQADGRILVAGEFQTFGSLDQRCLVRLQADGSHDPSFNANIDPVALATRIEAIELLADGKIYVGGNFSSIAGTTRNRIARLHPDGTLDATFISAVSLYPQCFAVQSDGKLLVGQLFGPAVVDRLNSDGTNDATFATISTGSSFDETIDMAIQPDGKILVGGYFNSINGVARPGLARLNANGTVDATFVPSGFAPYESKYLMLMPDGQCYVGGSSTMTPNKGFLVRLQSSGAIDPAFTCDIGTVRTAGISTSGSLIVGGDLRRINGYNKHYLVRLHGTSGLGVRVAAKCFLQGPFSLPGGRMNDGLRTTDLIPTSEPYSSLGLPTSLADGESMTETILLDTGNNAVVDWVRLELRDANTPGTIVLARSALVQRDGDIVELDGIAPVYFPISAGNYHVAVRHRNHLGVMTGAPIPLSMTPIGPDFTSGSTVTYGTNARCDLGGHLALWAGDVVGDGTIKYTGNSNDRDPILVSVGSTTPNNTSVGYRSEDVNLDGMVRYTGAQNDRDPILVNVGSTTPNNARNEQLP